MSMQPRPVPDVPESTAAVARAAFPKGCLAILVRDELGSLFTDEQFAGAFGVRGRPGWSPGQLALISVLQFVDNLTDRQAADAVRGRIDWKYALGLDLDDPGFDFTVLTGFRGRLVEHGLEETILEILLDRLSQLGLVRAGGRQRTDATHVLAAVRNLERLEFVGETLRAALEALAAAVPGWLAGHVTAEQVKRYGARVDSYRLPKGKDERKQHAAVIGGDGFGLLQALSGPDAPDWLWEIPAVQVLRLAWIQQYQRTTTEIGEEVAWRDNEDLPPGAQRLSTPYDVDARYSVKRGSGWNGYKVHLTETCEPETVHVITHVATTDATVNDTVVVPVVHDTLAARGLLPDEHDVDTGYMGVAIMLAAHDIHGIELLGPLRADTSWQTKDPNAFDASHFTIDFDARQVHCPAGKTSSTWRIDTLSDHQQVIRVDFRKPDCLPCPLRARCTTSAASARKLTFRPREQYEALAAARKEQSTQEWKDRYAIRAGVEGTMHQAIATTGIRRSRYIGLPKTHLAHIFSSAAINLIRLFAWWTGTPLGKTRTSHLSALNLALAA